MTIETGTIVRITKGCTDLGIAKGQAATVLSITSLDGDPHCAWILFQFPTHKRSMYVRYRKHLTKPEVKAHSGNPLKSISFRKA